MQALSIILVVLFVAFAFASLSESDVLCLVKCRARNAKSHDCAKDCLNGGKADDESESDWMFGKCAQLCMEAFDKSAAQIACKSRCGSFADSMSDVVESSISSQFIWQSYQAELFNFFKRGGSVTGLQLLRNPIPATWNTNMSMLSEFCNKMPSWGIEYEWSKRLVPQEYAKFVNNIKAQQSTGSEHPEVTAAKASVAEKQQAFNEASTRCKDTYQQRYGSRPGAMTYEAFQERFCYFVSNTEFELRNAEYDLQALVKKHGGASSNDVSLALAALEKAASFEWTETFVATLESFVQKIAARRADTFAIQLSKSSISQRQEQKDWTWEQIEKGNSTKGNDFFSTQGQGSTYSFKTSQDKFKMDISAEGFAVIPVAPASWYNADLIKKYKSGPFKDSSQVYFGQRGSLNLVPKQIYLLYKPSASIYLYSADAQYLKQLASKSATISFGPFKAKSNKVQFEPVESSSEGESLVKVTFASEEATPVVVAIENVVLP